MKFRASTIQVLEKHSPIPMPPVDFLLVSDISNIAARDIQCAINRAVQIERERCAEIAENFCDGWAGFFDGPGNCFKIAEQIRNTSLR